MGDPFDPSNVPHQLTYEEILKCAILNMLLMLDPIHTDLFPHTRARISSIYYKSRTCMHCYHLMLSDVLCDMSLPQLGLGDSPEYKYLEQP